MLTTLGNSNWLSGYYSVMFPFSMTLFHRAVEAGKKGPTLLAGTCNMLAMMLLLLQGSDSGVIVACTVMGLCFGSTGSKPDIGKYISFSCSGGAGNVPLG